MKRKNFHEYLFSLPTSDNFYTNYRQSHKKILDDLQLQSAQTEVIQLSIKNLLKVLTFVSRFLCLETNGNTTFCHIKLGQSWDFHNYFLTSILINWDLSYYTIFVKYSLCTPQ